MILLHSNKLLPAPEYPWGFLKTGVYTKEKSDCEAISMGDPQGINHN
ncbi:hypothetical protein [Cylindrospermopsis raciborskii]|nr:hypothetical protein [Cylindrospermopsis raciborskii]